MKKELNGSELAEFIMERQAHAVRSLRQAQGIAPKLAIVRTNPHPVVDSYMRIKQKYGDEILVDVDVHTIEQTDALDLIAQLNKDSSVHGVIVQIPLPDTSQTNEVLNAVVPEKDVDGLSIGTLYDAPTPIAINWLLSGYNVDLRDKRIVIVGHGRLVGRPLEKLWLESGLEPAIADKNTDDLAELTKLADILVTATGRPGLITADMVQPEAIIVDAGVATDSNGLIGDVAPEVRSMAGGRITPIKGGIGPLTVTALFENVITATRSTIK